MTASTYTTTQLATRVLRDAGLVGAEETPSSADLNYTIESVESEVQQMALRGIPIWNGSEVVVPVEYLTLLSRRLVLVVGPGFGLGDVASNSQAMELLEVNLHRIGQIGPTGAVTQGEYF